MSITFRFCWYDLWVGAYYDRKARAWYICPLPCCVFRIGEKEAWREKNEDCEAGRKGAAASLGGSGTVRGCPVTRGDDV